MLTLGTVESEGDVISARIITTPIKNRMITPKAHHSTSSIQIDFRIWVYVNDS
jgi:hypothetical protein